MQLRHVLGRLAHGDVDVREPGRRLPGLGGRRGTGRGAGLGLGEHRVVRPHVRRAVAEPADRLHPGGHEHVTLPGLDGVGRHADRLQGRGAVAVHRHARHVVQPAHDGHHPGQVVPGLAGGLGAAHDHVVNGVARELRELVQHRAHHVRRQVVRAAVHERSLVGPADGGPAGGDDDGFGHARSSWCWAVGARCTGAGWAGARGGAAPSGTARLRLVARRRDGPGAGPAGRWPHRIGVHELGHDELPRGVLPGSAVRVPLPAPVRAAGAVAAAAGGPQASRRTRTQHPTASTTAV